MNLLSQIELKTKKGKGKCVYAKRNFNAGEFVLIFQGDELKTVMGHHTLQIGSHEHLLIYEPQRYVNHSCNPNTFVKDKKDVAFGIRQGVDYVALSFVSSEKDIMRLRVLMKRIDSEKGAVIGIIPKIERPQAIQRFDAILEVSDGIMIARGDLGIEVPAEKVPVIQKKLIKNR